MPQYPTGPVQESLRYLGDTGLGIAQNITARRGQDVQRQIGLASAENERQRGTAEIQAKLAQAEQDKYYKTPMRLRDIIANATMPEDAKQAMLASDEAKPHLDKMMYPGKVMEFMANERATTAAADIAASKLAMNQNVANAQIASANARQASAEAARLKTEYENSPGNRAKMDAFLDAKAKAQNAAAEASLATAKLRGGQADALGDPKKVKIPGIVAHMKTVLSKYGVEAPMFLNIAGVPSLNMETLGMSRITAYKALQNAVKAKQPGAEHDLKVVEELFAQLEASTGAGLAPPAPGVVAPVPRVQGGSIVAPETGAGLASPAPNVATGDEETSGYDWLGYDEEE